MRLHENNWNFNILNLLLATVVCDLIMFWLWRGYRQTPIRNQCRLTSNVCSRELTEGFENVDLTHCVTRNRCLNVCSPSRLDPNWIQSRFKVNFTFKQWNASLITQCCVVVKIRSSTEITVRRNDRWPTSSTVDSQAIKVDSVEITSETISVMSTDWPLICVDITSWALSKSLRLLTNLCDIQAEPLFLSSVDLRLSSNCSLRKWSIGYIRGRWKQNGVFFVIKWVSVFAMRPHPSGGSEPTWSRWSCFGVRFSRDEAKLKHRPPWRTHRLVIIVGRYRSPNGCLQLVIIV